MSLKAFHLLFFIVVFSFLLYFGLWNFEEYSATSRYTYLVVGVLSLVMGAFVPVYLNWFLKKFRGIGFVALWFGLLMSEFAHACPVCVGDPNHPMVKSANNGVLFLLAVTAFVLVPFAGVFLYWAFKARRQVSSQ